jgi:ParB-like chromosome segregation protein Spo0J
MTAMSGNNLPVWPADQVERWDISRLKPYPQNPRLHPAANIAEIVASIERYGFTIPILVDEQGEVIAGAGRLEAAHKLGLPEVPVIVARGWSDAQKRSYRILDNSIPLGSTWSPELLKLEYQELKLTDWGANLLSFNIEPELLLAMDKGGLVVEEPSAPAPKVPKTHTTLFVSVAKTRADEARSLIGKALKRAGIDYNL